MALIHRLTCLLLLVLATTAQAQDVPTIKKTVASTIKVEPYEEVDGANVAEITTVQRGVFLSERNLRMLFEVEEHNVCTTLFEECKSYVKLTAYGGASWNETLWSLTDEDAQSGLRLMHDYYRTRDVGCCGADDGYKLYTLSTGRQLLAYSSNLLFINQPNDRFVGALGENSMLDFPASASLSGVTGLITYAGEDSTLWQVLLIQQTDEDGSGLRWSPEMEVWTESLKSKQDPHHPYATAYVGREFEVRAVYSNQDQVRLHVVNDSLDITRSSFPEGVGYIVRGNPAYLLEPRFQQLEDKSPEELRLLRNEIFARYGHAFSSTDLRQHFSAQPWYREVEGLQISVEDLIGREADTVRRILRLEQARR